MWKYVFGANEDSEGPDQTALCWPITESFDITDYIYDDVTNWSDKQVSRLNWAFSLRIYPKTHLHMAGHIWNINSAHLDQSILC